MTAENLTQASSGSIAARIISRTLLRGVALGLIWIAASLVFLLGGLELARWLGALDYQRTLTLMVLRVPIPGIWVSFFIMGLRFFALPSLVGGMAVSFYKEIFPGLRSANQHLHLLIGAFIGGLMAFAGLFGLFLSVGFFSVQSGWLFALLFIAANSLFGAWLTRLEVA